MSDLGSSAAVGIESVEWLEVAGASRTVRVTGRWRRRRAWGRAESRTPAMLVIDADGVRHRFPAMPEPPSLVGVAPGHWRLSFAVPAGLVVRPGHVQLTLGTLTVPLPAPDAGQDAAPVSAESAPTAAAAEPAAPQPEPVAPQPEPVAPQPEPAAPEPTPVLPEPVAAPPVPLSWSVPAPRADPPGGLREPDPEIERAWRRADEAEQRAEVEQARRLELERRLAETPPAPTAEPPTRAGDAPPAEAGDDPPAVPAPSTEVGPPAAESARLAAEAALRSARRADGPARVPAEPPRAIPGRDAPPRQGGAGLPEPDLVIALRRELGARVSAEAALRARLVQAESRLAARVLLEQRTATTLRDLRTELDGLREALAHEREARRVAEAQTAQVRTALGSRAEDLARAIAEVRGALDNLRAPAPELAPTSVPQPVLAPQPEPEPEPSVEPNADPAPVPASAPRPAPDPAGAVTPERLNDALARLREAQQPREPEPELEVEEQIPTPRPAPKAPAAPISTVPAAPRTPGSATLEQPFRRLVGQDADRAGRLLLSLLGAQHTAYPHPIAYDLLLGAGRGCVQVTVGEERPVVELSGEARAREQVAFQVIGDPARLARRLLAGKLRRWLRLGVARIRGDRAGFAALRALLSLPLDLVVLREDGMRADADTLLALVGAMIEPEWTHGERFTVACVDDHGMTAYLQIRDGSAPLVTRVAPDGRVSVSLRGPAAQVIYALAGAPHSAEVTGDDGAFAVLREWIERAQSG